MKHIVATGIKYIFFGIAWGCTCFVFTCLIGSAVGGQEFLLQVFNDFARQAGGSVLVGVACGSTAVIYQVKCLSRALQILIHFAIGIGVFFPTALTLGWIPFYPSRLPYTILQFLISCSIFAVIWLCFYLFNRSEAKKINNKLQELKKMPEALKKR